MAKTKYNPSAFRDDPLAALKLATGERTAGDSTGTNLSASSGYEESVAGGPDANAKSVAALSSAPMKPLSATLKPSRSTMYLYPEDLTKLRQLSGYASTEHGVRANDSMIVRAALSLMEADVRFLHALRDAELLDRRRSKG